MAYTKQLHPGSNYYDVLDESGKPISQSAFQERKLNIDHIPEARTLDNRSPSIGQETSLNLDRGNQKSYQIFNSAIQEMLRSAQKGLGTRQSQQAAIDLSNQQVQRGQAQATPGMNPSLQSSIRNADMNAINPSIQGSNDQTQTMQERLTGFKDVLAQTESFAQKMADEQFRNQQQTYKMIDDSIARLGSAAFEGMSEAELAQLEKTAGLPKNFLMRQAQALKKQEQEAARLAAIKSAGSGGGSMGDTSSKIDKRVKEIIAMNPANGQVGGRNNVPNGVQWDTAAAQIDAELGAGMATKYDNYLKSIYVEGKPPIEMSPYQQERITRNLNVIADLKKEASSRNTGWGSLLEGIPESEARIYASKVATLKANIAAGELTAMREASKTGGALGNVSDKELSILQDALGRLDTGVGKAAFLATLQEIEDSINRWKKAAGMEDTVNTSGNDDDILKQFGL